MTHLKKFIVLTVVTITIFSAGYILSEQTFAQSDYDYSYDYNSDDELGAAGTVFLGFMGLYYCYICLVFIATFLHMILSVVVLIDIAKKPNDVINKDLWIIGIVLPGTFIFLSQIGGVFISVGLELYYLLVKKNQIES